MLIHQPAVGGAIQGQVSDLEIQAAEIERMRTLMDTTLARHTGKDAAVIRKDTDRDKILTAAEAKDYGIIDTVLEYRKLSAAAAPDLAGRRTPVDGTTSRTVATTTRQRREARCGGLRAVTGDMFSFNAGKYQRRYSALSVARCRNIRVASGEHPR